ncbi:alkaline protease [uncultured Cardiobacterium sp.]|uniref:alkaline protease n=1 Tax=uncultured Cardiobacterium sp. TaxID=417619 RepID=UPI0026098243|nr:alkaline protease [uncultured Cardiobacterium sp.]
MKTGWMVAALLLLAACQRERKPFDGPWVMAPQTPLQSPGCAARRCPATHDPVCVTFDAGGRRQALTFMNACEVCIAPEHIVSMQPGACAR